MKVITVAIRMIFFFAAFRLYGTYAQDKIITVGFQFKPIFRGDFFNSSSFNVTDETTKVSYLVKPKAGFSGGMVIRKGFTKNISLETGINYVKRVHSMEITDSAFTGKSDFRIIAYEIPVMGLIYVRFGDHLYMNNAAGFSFDIFPSNIFTYDDYFQHSSRRTSWILPVLLANAGVEFRTDHIGYFYLGASYHRPFKNIMNTKIEYTGNSKSSIVVSKLEGTYLTVDIRYFFPENDK